MTDRIGNWLGMPDGRRFYPLDPRADEVRLEDIATPLSNLCRWGGRCSDFYSVAQHSVHVAEIVERQRPDLALAALMHDAAEAYIGDIVAPFKEHLWVSCGEETDPICATEAEILLAVHVALGIYHPSADERAIIKDADRLAMSTEARDLMGDPRWDCLVPTIEPTIEPMSPRAARAVFLRTFNRLRLAGAVAS